VRDAQPCIDAHPPQTYLHLYMKQKKLQLEEERTAIIEHDNLIVLEKMAHIMKTIGSADNRKPRQELLKVSKENATMMKRLIKRKLDINRENWKDIWAKNTVYFANIAKYDLDWFVSKVNKIIYF
ncbi:unnamed protein product, partial [Rotaria sp. Silwood1]